ncbi:MAG: GNAT family N-acetyltransferase [Chloroflexi bacterium]|nr:GNAT family N-acetyltransferase [Chloroflexota bacterium]
MRPKIDVRTARVEDKPAIVEFCRNTFSWGDYIPEVWDAWLTDRDGRLLIGVVGGLPAGVLHIAFIGDDVAWLEGMRVHPAKRRSGVATTLSASALDVARENGCRLARLATSVKNKAAQMMLQAAGYAPVATFGEWSAEPTTNHEAAAVDPFLEIGTRVAGPRDEETVLALWRACHERAASRATWVDHRWHWHDLSATVLRTQIAAAQVRLAADGFGFLFASDDDSSALRLNALAGDDASLLSIAASARGEAGYRGYAGVEAMLVDQPAVNAALSASGYRRDGGMLVYEQVI